jgi:hypothetical protein
LANITETNVVTTDTNLEDSKKEAIKANTATASKTSIIFPKITTRVNTKNKTGC